MPNVHVEVVVEAPIQRVWEAVKDVLSYPRYMDTVQSISVIDEVGDSRKIAWSVFLKGSLLQWTEQEKVEESTYRIEFDQIDGDLDEFSGFWQLSKHGDHTGVELDVDFEIGIPLRADLLNPVAARALRDNSVSMLNGIQKRVDVQ